MKDLSLPASGSLFPFQMEQWSTITSLIYNKNFWVRHDGPEREN